MFKNTILILLLLVTCNNFSQTTYYIDVDATDDTGNGTSEATAWKSINKVNDFGTNTGFNPGDQILFNSGDTFYGKLVMKSSGDINNQIVYGKYGGEARPIINGRNKIACIIGTGQEYYTINDLELVNNSDDDNGSLDNKADHTRFGFLASPGSPTTAAVKRNIILNNLKVHSIYPPNADDGDADPNEPGDVEYDGHGITFTAWSTTPNFYFDGITIENCEIFDTGILGIGVNKWVNIDGNGVSIGKHKNVNILNNYIHHTGGSGAVFFEVDTFLFENNTFDFTGDYTMDTGHSPSRQRGRGSGFWNVRTLNGVLQYNSFSNAHGPKDSCGAHIDIGNDNIIIQYNLSYNNAGGFAEFMGDNTNCIYRYNVSVNDGWRVKVDWTLDPTPTIENHPEMFTAKGESNGQPGSSVWFSNYYGCNGCDVASHSNQVYNNTIYIGSYNLAHEPGSPTRNIDAHIEFESLSYNNEIKNNLFYVQSGSSITYYKEAGVGSGNVMDYNMYNSNYPTDSFFQGVNDIHPGWPLFANAGGLEPNDYKIAPGSPAIDAGQNIAGNGGKDYFGNVLTGNEPTDIGAHETKSCGGSVEFTSSGWTSSPTSSDLVIIKHDYNTATEPEGSFEACQLIVNSGIKLTITADEYVKITGSITNRGEIFIEHEGSLVQVDDGAIVKKTGTGTIEVIKLITDFDDPTDFSIIGSPMTAETRDGVYNSSVVTMNHITTNFVPHPDVTTDDPDAENFADDDGDNWQFFTASEPILPGVGYLVGGPSGGGNITSTYTQGTLNNGVIPFTAIYNGTQNASPNILSNPYASAIDADAFISQNSEVDAIYYWEHLTVPGDDPTYPGHRVNNYEMGDISMYNLSGGLEAPNEGTGEKPTNQYIASGQGFGIKANAAGTINFNNSMRLTSNNTNYRRPINIDRLYLKVVNPTYQLQSSVLIAFTELATDGFESNYDSKRLATPISIYSKVEEKELTIQGRSPFNEEQVIPLGFRTMVEEPQIYTISLSSVEGEQISEATIYLKDNLLNTTTNLVEDSYTFTSNVSNQKDRFVIVFTEEVLGTNDVFEESISVYPNPAQDYINIISPLTEITRLTLYDVRGRALQTIKVDNQTSYQLDMSNLETSMYFVTIHTQNGSITKQIIKQ